MVKILKFWALCAIVGFTCGAADAQTPGTYDKARAVCIASVRVGQQAYLQATENAQTVHWSQIKQSVEFWGALQKYDNDFDIAYRAAIHIAFRLRSLGYAQVSDKISRPIAIEFLIRECYKE